MSIKCGINNCNLIACYIINADRINSKLKRVISIDGYVKLCYYHHATIGDSHISPEVYHRTTVGDKPENSYHHSDKLKSDYHHANIGDKRIEYVITTTVEGIVITKLQCMRCYHQFFPKKDLTLHKKCPKCTSRLWMKTRLENRKNNFVNINLSRKLKHSLKIENVEKNLSLCLIDLEKRKQ